MQISRKPLEHNRRHQNKKTGKCSIYIYIKLKYILEDRRTTLKIKIRTLHAYVGSIFLYISELWTVTQDVNTDKFTQKNTMYQVAREDQQHRAISENTGSQMESSHPETKTDMIWSHTMSR